jgi:ABC-type branched-subunit amino acid transport system substrate-binding protein
MAALAAEGHKNMAESLPPSSGPDSYVSSASSRTNSQSPDSLPVVSAPAPQQTNIVQRPITGQARFLLCLILIIAFVVFIRNSDGLQILGLIATLLSINLFEPIITSVDRFDKHISHLEKRLRIAVNHVHIRHFPVMRRYLQHLISATLVIVILLLLFHTAISDAYSSTQDFFCLKTASFPIPSTLCNTGLGVTTLSDGERIGLIGINNKSDAPFDPSRNNGEEAQVEQLIFAEDASACAPTQPHITLAVVTMFSRTIEDPGGSASTGLDDLQGAYLAQHDYNASHPAIHLCLVIANLGTLTTSSQDNSNAQPFALTQDIKQLVQYARYDSTFRGIVGFPYSIQVQDTLSILLSSWQETTIPIVSPSSTSNDLSTTAYPNFHRVSSPDLLQGTGMAQYVCSFLASKQQAASSVRVAIFSDSADSYIPSLSASFQGTLQSCLGNREHFPPDLESYQVGNAALIQKGVTDAIEKGDQYIFFAGYISDLDTVEAQVQRLQAGSSSRVTILGGDGLYDISDPSHNTFAPLYTTVYASPLDMQDAQSRVVFNEYKQHFTLPYLYSAIQAYHSYYLLPQDVIRGYEATEAFTQTLQTFTQRSQNTDLPQQADFDRTLAHISFTSFAIPITFQGQQTSDPLAVPVNIMCINSVHSLYWVATYYMNGQITRQQSSTCP